MAADDGNGRRLRSRRWFDDPADPAMTALYLERYMNYGITPEELRGGKPIIGIAQTGSDLSPCNRHHIELASRVRDGIRDAGGVPLEFPDPSDPGDRQAPDRGAGSQPRLSRPGRGAARLSDRRRRADHRLRQDHAGLPDGRRDGEHPGDRAVRRPDAGRLVARPPVRLRHDRLGGPQALRRGQDRLRRIHADGVVVGAVGRSLQHHGHRDLDELAGRGARHVAARLRGHPRAVSRARLDGVRDRQAHRRHGAGEPAPVRHHDASRRSRTRWSRPRRSARRRTARSTWSRSRATWASSTRWRTGSGLGPTSRCWCDLQPAGRFLGEKFHRAGGVPAVMKELLARRQAARRRDDRHRQDAGGEPARRAGWRSRGDPRLRQADDGGRRLRGDVGQPVRQRGDEDQRHRPGFPQALPVQSRPAERVRGQGDRVRRAGGLPPPHRGSRSRRRRAVGADHPQLRPGRLSRQRRSGEHAAAGCAVEARHRHAADDGRRAAVRHVGFSRRS